MPGTASTLAPCYIQGMDENPYNSPETSGAPSTESPAVWYYLKSLGLLGVLVISRTSLVFGIGANGLSYSWIALAVLSGPSLGLIWRRLSRP